MCHSKAATKPTKPTVNVGCTTIKEDCAYEEYTLFGKCNSNNSEEYYSRVVGKVDSIVKEGKRVKRGDTLLTIDGKVAISKKVKAQTNFDNALKEYNRHCKLYQEDFISKESLDQSKAKLDVASSDLSEAKNNYDHMVIQAPRDGYIGVAQVNLGDTVSPGTYLFSFLSLEEDKMVFINLPERLYSKLGPSNVDISTKDVSGNIVQGELLSISSYIDPTGMVSARVSFAQNINIVHGVYVPITLKYNQYNTKVVDAKSILEDDEGYNFVYKIVDEEYVKKQMWYSKLRWGVL